jgi:glycosyltransferase involved in cell wall biosynthesis
MSIMEEISSRKEDLRKKIRYEIGLKDNAFIVSVVARLVGVKKIDRFIKPFAKVCQKKSNIFALIVGDGTQRMILKNIAINTGAADRIFFLGHREDAKEIIAGSDLFVLPSSGEAFGIAALEALSLNVPTIVFDDVGGPKEFIKEGKNGFIVSNESDLANRILKIADNGCNLEGLENGEMIIKRDYDIKDYVNKIKTIYLDLLRNG